MQQHQARLDLGAMAMKGYSAFHKAPASLELHHQIVSCHYQGTHWRSLPYPQKCSRCILQPKPTGQNFESINLFQPVHNYLSIYLLFFFFFSYIYIYIYIYIYKWCIQYVSRFVCTGI